MYNGSMSRKWQGELFWLTVYTIAASLLSYWLIRYRWPVLLIGLISTPVIMAAFFLTRRLYISMTVVLCALSIWVIISARELNTWLGYLAGLLWFVMLVGICETARFLIFRQEQTQIALKENEEKLRSIFEQTTDAFTLCDQNGIIIEWNHSCETLTGIPRNEAIGQFYWDIQLRLLPPDRRTPTAHEWLKEEILEALNTGESRLFDQPIEGEIIKADGKQYAFQQNIFPIKIQRGLLIGSITRDITERKRMEEALRQARDDLEDRSTHLAQILQAGSQLRTGITIDTLLDKIVEVGHASLGYNAVCLIWLDEKNEQARVRAIIGVDERGFQILQNSTFPVKELEKLTQKQFKLGNCFFIPHEEFNWEKEFGGPSYRVEVAMSQDGIPEKMRWHPDDGLLVPISERNGKVFGYLSVDQPVNGRRPDLQTVQVLEIFANQAASAIENNLLFEQLQKELVEHSNVRESERQQRILADALREAVAAVNSSLQLDKVIELILDQVSRVVPCDASMIWLTDSVTGAIHLASARDINKLGIDPDLYKMRENITVIPLFQQMTKSSQPVVIPDIEDLTNWTTFPKIPWVRSIAGTRISFRGENAGFIILVSASPDFFNAYHAQRLRVFADQAAIAIENARLYSQVQHLAIVDDLTSLYNRRGLFELGRREVERALRYNRPLSALFVDIDHFKRFNDTYSYATGDIVLQTLAERLKSNTREIDVVGRYGGEEFVILIPESEPANAIQVAERIRQDVETLLVPTEWGDLSITISIGVAQLDAGYKYPPHTLNALIATAGEALHKAKLGGRNRVEVRELSYG